MKTKNVQSPKGIDSSPFNYIHPTNMQIAQDEALTHNTLQKRLRNFNIIMTVGTISALLTGFILLILPLCMVIASVSYAMRNLTRKISMKIPLIFTAINLVILALWVLVFGIVFSQINIPDKIRAPIGYTLDASSNIAYKFPDSQQIFCSGTTQTCDPIKVTLIGLTDNTCPKGGIITQNLQSIVSPEIVKTKTEFTALTKNIPTDYELIAKPVSYPNNFLINSPATIICN
jgi:hypothetical protein